MKTLILFHLLPALLCAGMMQSAYYSDKPESHGLNLVDGRK